MPGSAVGARAWNGSALGGEASLNQPMRLSPRSQRANGDLVRHRPV
jgi:hypothetical protein